MPGYKKSSKAKSSRSRVNAKDYRKAREEMGITMYPKSKATKKSKKK